MRVKSTAALVKALPDHELLSECASVVHGYFNELCPLARAAQPTVPPNAERFGLRTQLLFAKAPPIATDALRLIASQAAAQIAQLYLKRIVPFATISLPPAEMPSQRWAGAFTLLRTRQFQPRRLFVAPQVWADECKPLVQGMSGFAMSPEQASLRVETVLAQRYSTKIHKTLAPPWPAAVVFDLPEEVGQFQLQPVVLTHHADGLDFKFEVKFVFATRRPYAVITP